jgi:hypothetical protein
MASPQVAMQVGRSEPLVGGRDSGHLNTASSPPKPFHEFSETALDQLANAYVKKM